MDGSESLAISNFTQKLASPRNYNKQKQCQLCILTTHTLWNEVLLSQRDNGSDLTPSKLIPNLSHILVKLYVMNYRKSPKKNTKITSKHTEIKSTSCRYIFTGFKNVTFITVSNILVISSKNMWKYTKEPEFFSFSFLNPVKIYLQEVPVISVRLWWFW